MYRIFLVLSFCILPIQTAGSCYNRFPLKDTVDTVKALVLLHGVPATEHDSDGTEWVNLLIPEKEDGYELNGITYFLNDNHLPPEQTFYFNQIQFLSTQAFVVPTTSVKTWRASVPDRTRLLSKISFSCPSRQRVCGLRCCPEANYVVQQLFVDKISTTGKVKDDLTVRHREVTYNLMNQNATCDYTFSYYDSAMRKILDGQELTVYFDCPAAATCCGLTCSPAPQTEESRLPEEEKINLLQIKQVTLGGGCAVFFLLFALVTTLNYRLHRRKILQSQSLRMSESTETQTSRHSLEKEAFIDGEHV